MVGSRRVNATATDTPVPVDFIPLSKASEQGAQLDLAQSLQYLSPSFNSTRQTGADGADLIDSAALRRLVPTRRWCWSTASAATPRPWSTCLARATGAIRAPTSTPSHCWPLTNIQILRDGAAAQYGSDAIAGVMNIQLKKRKGCEAVFGYSMYSAGDGRNYVPSAYCGFGIGDGGTLGITAEYPTGAAPTGPRLANPAPLATPNQERHAHLNGDLPTSPNGKLYFTLGLQNRDASSAAWARRRGQRRHPQPQFG